MIKTRKSQVLLPIQEGVKYRTKMQTGDMFTVTRIVYRRKSKTDDTKIPYLCYGIYDGAQHLGECPLIPERLVPHSVDGPDEHACSKCGDSIGTPHILVVWDTAVADLDRNNGMFRFEGVRLRDCSLHFSDAVGYYVRYRDVTFGIHDVKVRQIS